MRHALVTGIQQALGWTGPTPLGGDVTVGTLPDPHVAARLLTPQQLLDAVMRRSLAPPQVRCVRDSTDVPTRDYMTAVATRRGQEMPMVCPRGLGRVLADGATLVVDALNRWDPTMEIACRALQWWAHEICQANLYLTTQDSSGFALHWDDHDVLIVQLDGRKHWEVRGRTREAPMFRDLDANLDPPEDIVWSGPLEPGDVLHIPRGCWHRATRADDGPGHSLHATFGLQQRTGVDLMSWWADQHTRAEPLFRHDLPPVGATPQRITEHTDRLRRAAETLLSTADPVEYRRWRRQQQPAARHVVTHGVFGEIDTVVASTEFPPLITVHNDAELTVDAAGTRLTLPSSYEPAVRELLSGHPVSIAAVAAQHGRQTRKIADVLLQEGLCAEVTDALRSGFTGLVPDGPCSITPTTSASPTST